MGLGIQTEALPACPPAEGLREIPLSLTLLSPARPSVEQKTDVTTETTDGDCLLSAQRSWARNGQSKLAGHPLGSKKVSKAAGIPCGRTSFWGAFMWGLASLTVASAGPHSEEQCSKLTTLLAPTELPLFFFLSFIFISFQPSRLWSWPPVVRQTLFFSW